MGKPRIVSFWGDSLEEQKSSFLMYVDPNEVELIVATPKMSEDELCEIVSGTTMILSVPSAPYLNRRILKAAKGVKLVKFISAGYEKIDLEAAIELGIPVANNTGVNSITVAEHALMMILVLQRKAFMFHSEVMEGKWPKAAWGDMWELRGRTLGILGLGAIGSELAKIAVGFGAKVLYNKRSRLSEEDERNRGVEYRSFNELLEESDVLSVHVPLTDETRHIIGEKEIALMKDGAIVINTSRKDVVDEWALSKALRDGKLYGVGIDVPRASEDRAEELRELFHGGNAITTSHIASISGQIVDRLNERISESIRRVLMGEPSNFLVY
jgi:glyoxylate reductase/D-3-phosphoglycerate dehydrogenase